MGAPQPNHNPEFKPNNRPNSYTSYKMDYIKNHCAELEGIGYCRTDGATIRYVGGRPLFHPGEYDKPKGYEAHFVINSQNDDQLWAYFNQKGHDTLRKAIEDAVTTGTGGRLSAANIIFKKGSIQIFVDLNDILKNANELSETVYKALDLMVIPALKTYFADFQVITAMITSEPDTLPARTGFLGFLLALGFGAPIATAATVAAAGYMLIKKLNNSNNENSKNEG